MSITSTLTTIGAAGAGGDINFVYEASHSSGNLILSAVCLDSQENIIATGGLTGTQDKVYVVKLDKNGNKLWDKLIAHSTSDTTAPMDGGIDVDSNDNIYLCLGTNTTSGATRLYKLDSDGNYQRHVTINRAYGKGNVTIGSTDAIWVSAYDTGSNGYFAGHYDTNLDDVYAYYFRADDTPEMFKFMYNNSSTRFYVYAEDRTGSEFYPYYIRLSDGTFEGPAVATNRISAAGPNITRIYSDWVNKTFSNSNSYRWAFSEGTIDNSQRMIVNLRWSSQTTGVSAAGITYHSDWNNGAWIQPYSCVGYGTTSGMLVGGQKRFGTEGDYAFIYRNVTPNTASSTRQVLAITHSSFTAVKTVSMRYSASSDFLVAGIGDATTNKTITGSGTGFIILKIPPQFTASAIAGTYGNTTLADKTGDFINLTATITNLTPDSILSGISSANSPDTNGSTSTATGISQTLTEI